MKIISKIVCVVCVLMSFQSYGQQLQNTPKITMNTYNFNVSSLGNQNGFTLTVGKQGISNIFDPSYGLARHADFTKVIDSYKQNLLSDTFVDTSFLYERGNYGKTSNRDSARPRVTNLKSFIVTGLVNTFFN